MIRRLSWARVAPLVTCLLGPATGLADTTTTFPASTDTWDYTFYPYMFFDGDQVSGTRPVGTTAVEAVSFEFTANTSFLYCDTQVEFVINGAQVAVWDVVPFEPIGTFGGDHLPLSLAAGSSPQLILRRISPEAEGCGSLILDEDVGRVTFHGEGSATPPVDEDGDGFTAAEDCDDLDADVFPGAFEACDHKDNNCDGRVDELGATPYYPDPDGDGFGVSQGAVTTCTPPAGYAPAAGDCNNNDPAINPAAEEICDGKDQDCDGVADDGAGTEWYKDNDRDGYGTFADVKVACTQPAGYVATPGDCNDASGGINPGAPEICDGIDNNCDQLIDNRDVDGDGYIASTCGGDDCNDNAGGINPGADELPGDGVDNDCDGTIDESTGGCPGSGTGAAGGSAAGLLMLGLVPLLRRRRDTR